MKKIQFLGVDHLSHSISWNWAFLLLSLDSVDRYWSEFGLDFDNRDDIRLPIREYIEAEQRLSELSQEEYHFSMESDLINDLLKKIAYTFGDISAEKILGWIEKRFIEADRADRWTTEWLFKFNRLEKYPIITGIGMDKLAALNTLADKISETSDQTATEIEELENEPKSDWDTRQYAIYRKENPDISPLEILIAYLDHWRFVKNWHKIVDLLTPAELDALELWAKGVHVAERGYGDPEVLTVPPEYRHPK